VLTKHLTQEMVRAFERRVSPHDANDAAGSNFTTADAQHDTRIMQKSKQMPNRVLFLPLHQKDCRIGGKDYEAMARYFFGLPQDIKMGRAVQQAQFSNVMVAKCTHGTCQRMDTVGKEHRMEMDVYGAHAVTCFINVGPTRSKG
jgi:hypothetical protein